MTGREWRADWRDDAACRDSDPELFFPTARSGPVYERQVNAAKAVCDGCRVGPDCLDEAMAGDGVLSEGVAGGLDEHERRAAHRWAGQVRDLQASLDRARAAVGSRASAAGEGIGGEEGRRGELTRWHADDARAEQADALADERAWSQ